MPLPWEPDEPLSLSTPTMLVDLRRCTGCHACAIACKVEHRVPLGTFRMRVRWMEDPSDGTMAFLPVFSAQHCDYGQNRASVGKAPACVAACATAALVIADADDAGGAVDQALGRGDEHLSPPGDTRPEVLYRGLKPFQAAQLNAGVALHPDDADIIYEQGGQS